MSKTCTSESCSLSYSETHSGQLMDLNNGDYSIGCRASGGGAYKDSIINFTVDKTPAIHITSPSEGSQFSGPFDVAVTATYKPTSVTTKGTINCAYGPKANPGIWGLMSKTCTSESCSLSYSEVHNGQLMDLNNGDYTFNCSTSAGGATVSDAKSIKIDKTPAIQITNPGDGSVVTGPFDVVVTATYKPTSVTTKGTINCAYGPKANPGIWGLMSKTCTSESCSLRYSETHSGQLMDLSNGNYTFSCSTSAGVSAYLM